MLIVMSSPPWGLAWRLALPLLILSACGSSSDGSRSAPGAPISAADFPALAADAYCKSIAHCCTKSTSDCAANVTATLQSALDTTTSDKTVFDPDAARACVDAIIAQEDGALCAPWFMSAAPSLAACSRVIDGTLQAGDACSAVVNCQRGDLAGTLDGGFAGCLVYGSDTASRCRTFVPTSTVGAACENADMPQGSESSVSICAAGLECTTDKTCAMSPAVGEPCPSNVCQPDAYCSAGTCAALRNEGEDCSQVPCVRGYSCSPGTSLCVTDPSVPWILSVGFTSTGYSCPQ